MRIRGIGTAKLVAKHVQALFGRSGPLILGYHRVARSNWDPQQICVSPRNFEEHLEVLTRLARPTSLQQFVKERKNGKDNRRSVVVTFDDAYEDTFTAAAPLLEQYAVPATVFVPTGMIGKAFWWCEIQEAVENVAELPGSFEIELGDQRFHWVAKQNATDDRAGFIHALCAFFRSLLAHQTDDALICLRAELNLAPAECPSSRAMTQDQIARLVESELIDVGSHTVTHASLNGLSTEGQMDELQQSKAKLEQISGRRVDAFAYPNGAVPASAPEILGKLGFSCGITSKVRPVAKSDNPFLLPRPFVADWDGDQFSRWLKRWLG